MTDSLGSGSGLVQGQLAGVPMGLLLVSEPKLELDPVVRRGLTRSTVLTILGTRAAWVGYRWHEATYSCLLKYAHRERGEGGVLRSNLLIESFVKAVDAPC